MMFQNVGALCQRGALDGATAPVALVTTFDSGKKGASVTLSDTDHTATNAASAGAVLVVDAMPAYAVTLTFTVVDSTNRGFIGVANSSISYNAAIGADTNGWSYVDTGSKRTNNGDTAYGASWAAGDVIVATYNAGSLSFSKNGADQGVAFTGLSGTLYFGWSNNLAGSVTIS